jgi:hypothetical protein
VGDERLFFANMGGYDPREFAELHRNILVVAPDAKSAKVGCPRGPLFSADQPPNRRSRR